MRFILHEALPPAAFLKKAVERLPPGSIDIAKELVQGDFCKREILALKAAFNSDEDLKPLLSSLKMKCPELAGCLEAMRAVLSGGISFSARFCPKGIGFWNNNTEGFADWNEFARHGAKIPPERIVAWLLVYKLVRLGKL